LRANRYEKDPWKLKLLVRVCPGFAPKPLLTPEWRVDPLSDVGIFCLPLSGVFYKPPSTIDTANEILVLKSGKHDIVWV
jgi:hypothetical protein